jgi:anti-sigma factor RsiW
MADMNQPPQSHERAEQWATHALRQLPNRRAPETLAPRILAAVRLQKRPWFQSPWLQWPRGLQLLSLLAYAGLIALIAGYVLPQAQAQAPTLADASQTAHQLIPALKPLSVAVQVCAEVGRSSAVFVRNLNSWTLSCVAGAVALIWCATLGLGTACWRLIRVQS